jgi:hypothetical protein
MDRKKDSFRFGLRNQLSIDVEPDVVIAPDLSAMGVGGFSPAPRTILAYSKREEGLNCAW